MKNIRRQRRKPEKPKQGDPRCRCGVQFRPQHIAQSTCWKCATNREVRL